MHANTPGRAAVREWDLALSDGAPEPVPPAYRFLDAYVSAAAGLSASRVRFVLHEANAWYLVELESRETGPGDDRIRASLTESRSM